MRQGPPNWPCPGPRRSARALAMRAPRPAPTQRAGSGSFCWARQAAKNGRQAKGNPKENKDRPNKTEGILRNPKGSQENPIIQRKPKEPKETKNTKKETNGPPPFHNGPRISVVPLMFLSLSSSWAQGLVHLSSGPNPARSGALVFWF